MKGIPGLWLRRLRLRRNRDTSFTHLTGYASNYYTYVLDKVIAVDFFA